MKKNLILFTAFFIFATICAIVTKSIRELSTNDSTANDIGAIDLRDRNKPLTNSEISGTYQGSYTDIEFNYTTAAKLTINADGTFIANIYIGGEEQTEKGLSPQKGKYQIRFEKEEIKNPYGELIGISYIHGIDLNAETPFGIRTSTYTINNNFELFPSYSFINQDAILKKN